MTRFQIQEKVFGILLTVENKEDHTGGGRDVCSKDLASALYNLHTYAAELGKNQEPEAINKSNAIILLLNNLYNVQGKTDFEKLLAMKKLVGEELKKHESGESPLLKNRGLNLYSAASCVATFFGKPDYKIDVNGKRYYANSSTEHRLIQLYHALSIWTYCFIPGIPRMLDTGAYDPQALEKYFDKEMPYCSPSQVNNLSGAIR